MKTGAMGLVVLVLLTAGCAIRKPIQAMYCERKTPDGKHCAAWAKHQTECVHDAYGDCTAETR
jgi:hypothetical protein